MFVPLNYLKKILKIDETSKSGLRWKKRNIDKSGWNNKYAGKEAGTLKFSSKGLPAYQIKINYNGISKKYYVHRIIYYIYHGHIDDKLLIDHKNGNPLDNKIKNLRMCTHSQNRQNSKIQSTNKLGYKNIIKNKNGTYRVYFNVNKKRVYFGTFKNLKKAIAFANKKRKEIYGEFSRNK